ncbi:MAG: hypothetical protein V1740_06050 [Candidatus Woesearchaeota archaeon]
MELIKKIVLIVFLALLIFEISIFVSGKSCIVNEDCDDEEFCTTDRCINETNCPAGCTASNCTTCTNRTICKNDRIASCSEQRYVRIGEHFSMGKDSCQKSYIFEDLDEEDNYVVINGQKKYYPTDNASLNKDGYKIRFGEDYNVTYTIRYNEENNILYLEDVNPSCPIRDTCNNYLDCNDENICTIDDCAGFPRRCINKPVLYCKDDDSCCPERCNYTDDNDCEHCVTNIDCNDSNITTMDYCETETGKCLNRIITICMNNDTVCPGNCNYLSDSDCIKPFECGNNICEPEESSDTCCVDCGCGLGLACKGGVCEKTERSIMLDALNNNPEIIGEIDNFMDKGYLIFKTTLSKEDEYWEYEMILKNNESEKYLSGRIYNETYLTITKQRKINWKLMITGVAVSLVILLTIIFSKIKMKKREKEPEDMEEMIYSNDQNEPPLYQDHPRSYYGDKERYYQDKEDEY